MSLVMEKGGSPPLNSIAGGPFCFSLPLQGGPPPGFHANLRLDHVPHIVSPPTIDNLSSLAAVHTVFVGLSCNLITHRRLTTTGVQH